MAIKYSNNAKTTVSAAGITGTTINVVDASTFPIIDSVDDYTYITLLAGSTAQIFKADTIDHANNVIIVDVAPDSAVFVPNSTRVELRLTAELLSGVMDTHEHTLDGITGVTLSTPLQDQVLTWNGAAWTNAVPAGSGGNVSGTLLDGGDASGIFTGVSIAEQSSGQGVTVYPDAAALVSVTLVTGALAYVQDIDKLLLCTGTAWSSLAVNNDPPTVTYSATAISGHYQIPGWPGYDDITVTAVDPDGVIPTITIESNTMTTGVVEVIGNSIVRITPDQVYEYNAANDNFVIKVTDGETVILQTITVEYTFAANVVGQQNFFSTTNFTVPDNVFTISYILIGGGGGAGGSMNPYTGGYYKDYLGGDGGSAARTVGIMVVTPGSVLPITVGAGGTTTLMSGPQTGTSGGSGGTSSITIGGVVEANAIGGSGATGRSPIHNPYGAKYGDGYDGYNRTGWTSFDSQISSWTSTTVGDGGTAYMPPTSSTNTYYNAGNYGLSGAVRLIWGLKDGVQREFNASGGYGTEDL
jgi:hypothetical protein